MATLGHRCIVNTKLIKNYELDWVHPVTLAGEGYRMDCASILGAS